MQTNETPPYNSCTRPVRRRNYEEVGPPAVPPKARSSKSDSDCSEKGKLFSNSLPMDKKHSTVATTKSPSMQSIHTVFPPPLPSTARPTSAASTIPPRLPPRNPPVPVQQKEGYYSSPRSEAKRQQPVSSSAVTGSNGVTDLYNVPTKSQKPPSYDSLASISNNSIPRQPTAATTTPKTGSVAKQQTQQSLKLVLSPSPKDVTAVSESMSLSTLVEKHQNDFPVRVEVTAGYFGESERDTFSEGDVLNIHFIKQITVAVIDCGGGKEIKIPLNSTIRFSPLYDPNNNFKEAKNGITFKTIKDVLAGKKMPMLMLAKRNHKNMNTTHSVEKGDLLKIIEVKQGKFGGQSLVCMELNGKKMKRLSESCQGEFTTGPDDLKLYLPEFTSHFSLPQRAVPFINYMEDRDLPFAESEMVTILRVEKEKTIVATALLDEKDSFNYGVSCPVMFEIPTNLEVLEVQIVEENDVDDYEKLYADTREMMVSFDPTKKDNQVRVGKAESIYYCDVRKDQKTAGIELIASESIYQDTPSLLAMRNSNTKRQAKNDDEYSYTGWPPHDRKSIVSNVSHSGSESCDSPQHRDSSARGSSASFASLGENTKSLEKTSTESSTSIEEYCVMNDTNSRLSPFPSNSMKKCSSNTSLQEVPTYEIRDVIESMRSLKPGDVQKLEEEMQEMKSKHEKMSERIRVLEQENMMQRDTIEKLQQTVQTLQRDKSEAATDYVKLIPSGDASIGNCDQLLDFLDKANMSKYKEQFRVEQVDRLLLAQLDEEILEKELGVGSKLHRKKLILYAQGKM